MRELDLAGLLGEDKKWEETPFLPDYSKIENGKLHIAYCKLSGKPFEVSHKYDASAKTLTVFLDQYAKHVFGSAMGVEVIDLPADIKKLEVR